MFRSFFVLTLLAILTACNQPANTGGSKIEDKPLFNLMTGSFNSKEQSLADSAYFNISLHMYPIWTDLGGQWLYVEQALASAQNAPYRQRVYHLENKEDGTVKSSVFTLVDEQQFIGKWKEPGFFDQFVADSILIERTGCAVYMKRTGPTSFEGSTRGKACESALRGASYATSRVKVTNGRVVSWDQGFNSDDEQVWGATKGPYVFDKLTDQQ